MADLLRRTLEEQRDEVPLRDEWRFVSRYLAIEQMRFGERLVVNADLPPDLQSERVPSFALQTLVENAVQHGAAPRVAPTEIAITATRSDSELVISVRNSGDRDASPTNGKGTGTGLARLRERLSVLYGGAATLVSQTDRGRRLRGRADGPAEPPERRVKVTVLVVDDEPIARAGLKGMLSAFDWIEVIGEAADGQSARAGDRDAEA